MDKFEKWFNKVNEELAVSPTINTEVADVTVTDVDADRSNMIGDIDTIMTSLETLADELTEELELEEDLNEAGGVVDKTKDFIKSWITGMKATKAQGKVNKIKMNVADLRFAADTAKDSNSGNLDKKATAAKDQAKDLQTLVDKKFAASGSYVTNKLQAAKIAGQIEIIKRTTGMEDDPKKKAALKDKMVELAVKYKEEVAATKELEDENKEVIAANKKKKKTKEDTTGDDKQGASGDKDNRTDAEKQADAAKEEETRKATLKNADGADDATKADREKKNSKDGLMDRYKVLLKKAQDNDDETKAKDIQSKIDAISKRESWQLDGTELGRIFEMELIRYENSFALNESRHNVDSIKDKFNTLLNS